MDSDEELPDEPPPEYLQMRRRSNTLPKDFLSKLKSKRDPHDVLEDSDGSDDVDGHQRAVTNKELTNRLLKLDREKETNGFNKKAISQTPPQIRINNQRNEKHILPPIKHRKPLASSDERLNKPQNAEDLLNKLIKVASDEALECTTKNRGPLPRGSSLYESLLKDFGREEEERDFLSPLPSPNLRHCRRQIRSANNIRTSLDIDMHGVPSSPPSYRKHVHWSQDTHFNKYK